jgi:DNA mismatch endonuclease, patch repair protein
MGSIRSTNNKTETALRKKLHAMGLRYRKYARGLPGKPDIVFPAQRVVVFVDGDYWHGRILRENGYEALKERVRRNPDYWLEKFQRNVARDDDVKEKLERLGWIVLRFWESDVRKNLEMVAQTIAYRLNAIRNSAKRR